MDIPIKAVIHRDERGGYTANVPALRGCWTEADTMDELLRNIREVVEGWLLASHDVATDASFGHMTPEEVEEQRADPGEVLTL